MNKFRHLHNGETSRKHVGLGGDASHIAGPDQDTRLRLEQVAELLPRLSLVRLPETRRQRWSDAWVLILGGEGEPSYLAFELRREAIAAMRSLSEPAVSVAHEEVAA